MPLRGSEMRWGAPGVGRPRLAQAGGRCLQCWWVTCGPEFSALPSLWAPWDQLGKPGSPQDGEQSQAPL